MSKAIVWVATFIRVLLFFAILMLLISKLKFCLAFNEQSSSDLTATSDEFYSNLTIIDFLKDIQRLHKFDSILLMSNQNSTINEIFYQLPSFNGIKQAENEMDTKNNNISIKFQNLLIDLDDESTSPQPSSTFLQELMLHIEIPVILFNELPQFYLRQHFGEGILSIIYLDMSDADADIIGATFNNHYGLMKSFTRNLLHITSTKVLFLIHSNVLKLEKDLEQGGETNSGLEDIKTNFLKRLFEFCWRQKMINVVALLSDYQVSRKFYSYTHFPEFQLETNTIQSPFASMPTEYQIYPYRLGNLHSYELPVVIGGTDPRLIPIPLSENLNDPEQYEMAGFVGHFITTFCEKFNCILVQPLPFNPLSPIPSQDLIKAVRNSTVEISAAITFPTIPSIGFSYPYEQVNWCLMLPLEPDIPSYTFFTAVFKGETYVLFIATLIVLSMVLSFALYIHGYVVDIFYIICHDDCLRGMLGQSFTEVMNPPAVVSFIYLQICILGILSTTTYNSYFSTYVTKAPKEAALETIDDILLSGMKVLAWEPEYNEVVGRAKDLEKYSAMFYVEKSFQRYLALRDSLNTKYGYVTPNTKWTIVNEQQKIFSTPLFRQTASLCIFNNIPMCFPVHENSVFNPMIYQLIMETGQSGLMDYWRAHGFWELIKAKKLDLVDLSTRKEFSAMQVGDLRYIFIFLGIMLVVSVMAFLGELAVYHRSGIRKYLRNITGRKVKLVDENQVLLPKRNAKNLRTIRKYQGFHK